METAEHFEAITEFPPALRNGVGDWGLGWETDVMALSLINYKCCTYINIQTFSKPQKSLEVIQRGQKKQIRLITGGQ